MSKTLGNVKTFGLRDPQSDEIIAVTAWKSGKDGWYRADHCPRCQDTSNESLAINPVQGVFKCHRECGFQGNGVYLDVEQRPLHRIKLEGTPEAVYEYYSANNEFLFQMVKTRYANGTKGLVAYRENKNWKLGDPERDQWIPGAGDYIVPYHLPEILASTESIYLCEGEKDCDTLAEKGLVATTNPFGAGHWKENFSKWLENRDVIFIPDCDEFGRRGRDKTIPLILKYVKCLTVIDLKPYLPEGKKDVTEFFEAGHSLEELFDIIARTEPTTSIDEKNISYEQLNLPNALEISHLEIHVEWVVHNVIPKAAITLFHSIGGTGKTILLQGMGCNVVNGTEWMGLKTLKMPVYYLDYENPLAEIADRMKRFGNAGDMKIWHMNHEILPVRFDSDEWKIYKTFPPGLLIIDSLRSSQFLDEDKSKDAAFIMSRMKELRATGMTIVLIHHENKSGEFRGSTEWYNSSDHILKFSRVANRNSDKDVDNDADDYFEKPIRLIVDKKSRFAAGINLGAMYFKFTDGQLIIDCDPDTEILEKMKDILNENGRFIDDRWLTFSEFWKLCFESEELEIKSKKRFVMLLNKGQKGQKIYWEKIKRTHEGKSKLVYVVFNDV